jgi:hypothetical protein
MVMNPKPGHHAYTVEIADVLWQKLCDEYERSGRSIAKILQRALQDRYKVQ